MGQLVIQAISLSLERSSFGYPGLTFDNIDLNVIFITFSGVFRSAMTIIFKVCLITRRSIVRSSRFIFAVFRWFRWFFLFSRSCRMLSPARCSSFLLFLELFDVGNNYDPQPMFRDHFLRPGIFFGRVDLHRQGH